MNKPLGQGEDERDAHRDTPLGRTAPGLSPETAGAVRREMDGREAAGLPAVPEMHREDRASQPRSRNAPARRGRRTRA